LEEVKGAVGKLRAKTLGRPRRLDATQCAALSAALLKGALQAGFPTELWTRINVIPPTYLLKFAGWARRSNVGRIRCTSGRAYRNQVYLYSDDSAAVLRKVRRAPDTPALAPDLC
jgi:hypothetical protein